MQDDDTNQQALHALEDQESGTGSPGAESANQDQPQTDLNAPGEPGTAADDGDGTVGGRPSEDGDADGDVDEADAGQDHDQV